MEKEELVSNRPYFSKTLINYPDFHVKLEEFKSEVEYAVDFLMKDAAQYLLDGTIVEIHMDPPRETIGQKPRTMLTDNGPIYVLEVQARWNEAIEQELLDFKINRMSGGDVLVGRFKVEAPKNDVAQ